jgi:hypothetical protein
MSLFLKIFFPKQMAKIGVFQKIGTAKIDQTVV